MTKLRSYIPVAQSYQLPGPTYRLGEAHAGAARFESDDQRAEFLRARTRREGLWSSLSTQARLEARVARWFAAAVRRDESRRP